MLRNKSQVLWIVLMALLIALAFFMLGDRSSVVQSNGDFSNTEDSIVKIEEEGEIVFSLYGDAEIIWEQDAVDYISATSVTFGDNVGKISWEEGTMTFEGNADESARMFFEGFLKPLVDEYIESELEEGRVSLGFGELEPEHILFQYTTTGQLAKTFKPQWFLKVVGTDLDKCFIDGRLRLNLNGEIYWIRLEKDSEIEEFDPAKYTTDIGEEPGFWFAKPEEKEEPNNVWPVIRLEAYEGGWLQPSSFMETINTDISKMINDGRLRLIINGETYWIRLRADDWKPSLW